MSNETPCTSAVDVFIKRRLITEVLDTIKSGKEATVYRCRAHPQSGVRFYALKVHRPIEQRSFKNDSLYHHGRVILQTRMARAFASKTRFGHDVQSMTWIRAEYETLRLLCAQGASVPEPIACEGRALLMEWIGDDEPAPTLARCRLDPARAETCLAAVLSQVALWLRHNRVHADLSGFNILYHEGGPVVIDFPQSVDPRTNANARELLERDLRNLAQCFERSGVACDPLALAHALWQRWERPER